MGKKINQIKDEKERRRRFKGNDSLSYNSSGHLINFMRPYNPDKRSNSGTHRSLRSSPQQTLMLSNRDLCGMNTTREYY